MTLLFPLSLFEAVAAIVKPRKRRTCSFTDEQQRINGERLRAMKRAHAHKWAWGLETLQMASGDPEAV